MIWLAASILSIVVMALTGLWVFIVLQLGYITNTIYGYLKWTKYIKENQNGSKDDSTNQDAKPQEVLTTDANGEETSLQKN